MGRIPGVVLWLVAAAVSACAEDAGWREVFAVEPFTGGPRGTGFAGRLGFAWGEGPEVGTFDLETGTDRGSFTGHASEITAAAGSPDGSRVASGDASGTVRIWEATTRREALRIDGPPGAVVNLRWTPTGGHIAWVGEGGKLSIARVETGRTVADHDMPAGAAGELVFSADGKWARLLEITSAWDGRETLSTLRTFQWNLLDGGNARRKAWERRDGQEGARPYEGARVDPRDGRIAFPDGDDLVVWSMDDDREAFRLEGMAGPAAFRADGDVVAASPRVLAVADAAGGSVKKVAGVDGIRRIEVTGDGKLAVGIDARGTAWCWPLARGGAPVDAGAADDIAAGASLAAVVSPGGRATLVRSSDAALSPVDLDPGAAPALAPSGDRAIAVSRGRPVIVKFGEITGVAAGEESRAPATALAFAAGLPLASGPREAVLFDAAGGEIVRAAAAVEAVDGPWFALRAGRDLSLRRAPDGAEAAVFRDARALSLRAGRAAALAGNDAVVLDAENARELFRLRAPAARSLALVDDGASLLLGTSPLELWNLARSRRTWTLGLGAAPAFAVAQPGGDWLAAGLPSGDLSLVDDTGDEEFRVAGVAGPSHVAFTADGLRLIACADGHPRAWPVGRRRKAVSFPGEAGPVTAAPSGARWFVLTRTGIDLYEADRFLQGFPGATSGAFLPGGALAVAAPEGVRIWDGAWASRVCAGGKLVAVSPDGSRIAVADGPRVALFEPR